MAKQQTTDTEYRISRLARMFGLSRSTLLYYDRIGLLRPTGRTDANYRIYNHADLKRLEQICRYRRTGMALETIAGILSAPRRRTIEALERRLDALNQEIQDLRAQQQVITKLLKDKRLLAGSRVLDKQRWVALLRAAGLDDEAMGKWHVAFEKMSPEAHQDFLESLGIDSREIAEIRTWSAKEDH
jgi:DNA-binding transcriptional MerR regulator